MTAIRPRFWSIHALTFLAHAMLGFVLFAAPAVTADETGEPISGLIIEDAVVSVAPKGGTATLGFRIENLSSGSVSLIGVRSMRAGKVVMRVGTGDVTEELTALAIHQDETLDLRSSHIRIELRNLVRPIKTGEMVRSELVFNTGTAIAEAHAH